MSLKIFSINCKGLKDFVKRDFFFNLFQILGADLVFLQETHCDSLKLGRKWASKWGAKCFWSFGTAFSSGVGILVGKNLVNHVKGFDFDVGGKILSVTLCVNDIDIQCINIYAPNCVHERKQFLTNIYNYVNCRYLIVGGDLNFVENVAFDKAGGNLQYGEGGIKEINSIKSMFDLYDPFRDLHPDKRVFSWSGNGVSCRLDRFYVAKDFMPFVSKLNYFDSIKSDHKVVELVIDNIFSLSVAGPGFWHCNTQVMCNENCKAELEIWLESLIDSGVKNTEWWESLKLKCKQIIVHYSKELSSVRRAEIIEIKSQLRKIDKNETNLVLIDNLKQKLTLLIGKKGEGEKVRSKAKILGGEHPSTYF